MITIRQLKRGDIVQHIGSGNSYIIIDVHQGTTDRALAIREIEISNPDEWVLVPLQSGKAGYDPEGGPLFWAGKKKPMTDKPPSPITNALQQKLGSEVVDWSALWDFVDEFDDIPRAKGSPNRTVTPTLAFRMRYNEDGTINHTLKEIGDHFGVCKQAVRHHIETGIRRLNHPGRRVRWGMLSPELAKQFRQSDQNKSLSERRLMTEVNDRRYMRQYEKRNQDNSIKAQLDRRLIEVSQAKPHIVVGRIDSQCFIISLLMEMNWLQSMLISLERYIGEKQQGLVIFRHLTTDGHLYIFTYGFSPAKVRGFQLWILLDAYVEIGQHDQSLLLAQIEDGQEILSQCLFDEKDGWLDTSIQAQLTNKYDLKLAAPEPEVDGY